MARCRPERRGLLPLRPRPLALAAAALLAGPCARAQGSVPEAVMPNVVVSATRSASTEDDVAATVSVITDQDIARRQAADVHDLVRYEPGVSVRALPNRSSAAFYSTGRGGNEGINIRGLEGNQVMLQVDGVRLPMAYSSGPVFAGRGDYIDVEAFKRVELLRGPSSTSYGSDGLAGAVSFVTKDPADLLTLGQPTQAALKVGQATADRSWSVVPSFAARGEQFEGMVLASLRRGHETANKGDIDVANATRTRPNPQDVRSDYVLGKLVYKLDARQRVKLSAEHLARRIDTDVLTLFGDPMYLTTTDVDARERITRSLVKLDYEYLDPRNAWFQRAQASVYGQDAKNRQYGFERRTNTTAWNTRERDNLYGERATGAALQFESNFGQDVAHHVVWGLDASTTRVDSLKDGANFLDGQRVTSGSSAFAVNKSFPDTDYRLLGLFAQDEITAGRLSLIPGLRWDRFALDPRRDDPLYTVNNATPAAALSGRELSPKLGLIWTQSPLLKVFAQYAHGFRAPTPAQVNGGVTNLTASQPYRSIGNPDLRPETSDTVELGLRGRDRTLRYSASVFKARYKDFILANQRVGGSGTASDPTVFQSVNASRADIRGLELSAAWTFVPGWTLSGSYARARGDTQDTAGVSRPLETIEPQKLVLGLRYERARQGGAELLVTGVKRPSRVPDPAQYLVPPGFALADAVAWFELDRRTSVNLAVTNLFDRKVVLWADARGLLPGSTLQDAYSQPGRSLSASMRHQF